jgi:hypothetical protein
MPTDRHECWTALSAEGLGTLYRRPPEAIAVGVVRSWVAAAVFEQAYETSMRPRRQAHWPSEGRHRAGQAWVGLEARRIRSAESGTWCHNRARQLTVCETDET